MGNMSYCRFRNTLEDLRDCYAHINDYLGPEGNDKEEEKARGLLIALCRKIAED